MFKAPLLLAVAAVGVVSMTAPVLAKGDAPATTRLTIEQRNGKTFYCVDDAVTAARVPKHICKDRADWAAEGLVFPEQRAADTAKPQQPKSAAGGSPTTSVPAAPAH